MDYYFVYSSGGGGGDWNGIDRVFKKNMPIHFKKNLLIKFGDIYFNHKGSKKLLKQKNWDTIDNARDWLINNTGDSYLNNTSDLIMDVGTTKIVNYVDFHNPNFTVDQIINEFDRLVDSEDILEKYAEVIFKSKIDNAITFDIPNPFKIRNQGGNAIRNIFNDPGCKSLLTDKCVKYANKTYKLLGNKSDQLLTILPAFLSDSEIKIYLKRLVYKPKKIAIGALIEMRKDQEFTDTLLRLDSALILKNYSKVHFLGCGGLKKARLIKNTLGNHSNFSVDNTTAYNRSFDGNTRGTAQSCYIDYLNNNQIRITPSTKGEILKIHSITNSNIKHFSDKEMKEIINSVLEHQSQNSSTTTYDNRAKLAIHNFDVFKDNAD